MYYYIVVVEVKTPYHMFTLEEALILAAKIKAEDIIFYPPTANSFYWLSAFAHLSTQKGGLLLNPAVRELHTPRIPIELDSEGLALISNYFEPAHPNYIKISPACLRLPLEEAAINPLWLFEKIAYKTVFIVHKKNNEYFRTGPFLKK